MKRRIDDCWEFTPHWSDEFLQGAKGEQQVRIPHTVKEIPLHYADPSSYQMIAGYRRVVRIPEEEKGRRHFLQFDAAAHIADVYFNGTKVCTHRCGYTAFRTEITNEVRYGEDNVITVRLDTTENPEIPPFGFVIDYLTFGGIYRDVWLEDRPQAMISDAWVTTPDLQTANVALQYSGDVSGKKVHVMIRDSEGRIAAQTEDEAVKNIRLSVKDARPWSCDTPALYTCEITMGEDRVVKTFGFRTVQVTENDILLNGSPVFLRGLNRHQCYPYVGYAVSDSLQREDARILDEELGVNAVRTSHYPQSHAFIDECDRRGILVFTEIPGWQHLGDRAWKQQAIENTREMVLEYRQHPSIIIWGVRINESLDDDELYRATNEMAHRLDPTRPTSGVRYLEKSSLLEDIYGYNDFSHNGITPGAKAKKDVTPDVKKPLLITEANGHMFPTKNYDTWEKRQEHALRHARVLNAAMADGGHAGCFQWCMFDYPTHKDFGSGDRICYHGVMDSFRNPKMAASVYASQSEKTPVLEIGSPMDIGDYPGGTVNSLYVFTNADEVNLYKNDDFVKTFRPDRETWQGISHPPVEIDDMIGCLLETKEGFSGTKERYVHDALQAAAKYGMANMPVKYKAMLAWCMLHYKMKYSEGVELYGKYVGSWGGDSTEWRFEAVKDGKPVAAVVKSPRTALHLDVRVSQTELTDSDTYDMTAFRIRILDELDNSAVYTQLPVRLKAEGPVEIVGPDTVTAEGGMCGTYVRTTGEAGNARLTISADGLTEKTIDLVIRKGERS
ncbi:MAG: glycoside hydrolase family 2 protein [Erysipelotrichaceae bacterium]|nr:glycoside hydrolase family 2 protein [Erysipelotrichaceae bacterium]